MSKPIIHSHSANETFDLCPYKYEKLKISKEFVEETNEAAEFGDKQHEILEHALLNDTPLTGPAGDAIDWVRSHTGLKIAEAHLGIDRRLRPCGYYDKELCWFRAKVDVTILNGDKATIIDYKTGKRRVPGEQRNDPTAKPKESQMIRYALLTFLHYPHVQDVESVLYWTHSGDAPDSYHYNREADAQRMIKFIRETPRKIEAAQASDEWPKDGQTNAPGLCSYCPVIICPSWRSLKKKPKRMNG